jgi:LemA protein
MKKLVIALSVVVGLILIAAITVIGSRNKLVTANEMIRSTWAQVENVMQRRADLIPNLVNTVKGYAKQEQQIFTAVAEARAKLAGARTINEKIGANQQIESALSRLLMVVENYPQLKSDVNFRQLQDELAGTENRIAVERMRFNEAVKSYNLLVRLFPTNIAANFFNYQPRDEYFEPTPAAQEVPQVSFE